MQRLVCLIRALPRRLASDKPQSGLDVHQMRHKPFAVLGTDRLDVRIFNLSLQTDHVASLWRVRQ
jgi:hypothetical protein